jgi:hypothetical protein
MPKLRIQVFVIVVATLSAANLRAQGNAGHGKKTNSEAGPSRAIDSLSANFLKKETKSSSISISGGSTSIQSPDWEMGTVTSNKGGKEIEAFRSPGSKYFLSVAPNDLTFEEAKKYCESIDPAGKWAIPNEASLRKVDELWILAGIQNLKDGKLINGDTKIVNNVATVEYIIETNHLPKKYWLSDPSGKAEKDGTYKNQKTYKFNHKEIKNPSIGNQSKDKAAAALCFAEDR